MSDYSASYNYSQYWWQPHAQPELSLGPAEHIGSDEQDPNFRGQGFGPSNHPGPLLDDYDDYTYAEHAPFRNATSCPESHWQEASFDGQRSSSDPPNPLDEIYTGQVTPFQYATFGQDLLWQGLPSQGGSSYSRSTSLGSELRGRGLFDHTDIGIHQNFLGYEGDVLSLESASPVSTINEGPSLSIESEHNNQPPIPIPTMRPVVSTPAIIDASGKRRLIDASFACPYQHCTGSFTTKHNYEYHIRAHKDERPFGCDICPGATFRAKGDLARHKRSQKHASRVRVRDG